jgi:membrane-bound metal-dependent hydrolase YbcI (DUF457 family)
MADFKTHITTSTAIGIMYGAAGYTQWQLPASTCVISGALCGLAGMLPDMDSDSGHAQREVMTFTAALMPMLMLHRFAEFDLTHEQMALSAGCVYIIVRFGFGEILRRYTVHRGMFHSIPAAVIAGLVTSLVCSCPEVAPRAFKVGAVVLGYLVHLLLDELWAIEWYGRIRLKNSFGTAFKMFSKRWFPNVFTYGVLLAVGVLAYHEPTIMQQLGVPAHHHSHFASDPLGEHDHEHLLQR